MAPGEKNRVLIVDDIAETRENVRKLLQFESDIEVVGAARTGKEAIQQSQELSPDVVLMDINMPDMDGIAATEAIRQKQPSVQIVILSVQGDQNYMRRAMLAGARDFLTKPPMADELVSAIRRAGEMARQERAKAATVSAVQIPGIQGGGPVSAGGLSLSQGKVITVYSPKGGTGVTTLAVNLGIGLHNDDTKVVVVDGNLQFGDVAIFLNEQGKNTIIDLAPRADELEPDIVEGVLIKHQATGIRVLAAPTKPEHAEQVTGEQFGKVIDYLRRLFAYVVIDSTSMLNDITLSAIDTSDAIVLVTTQDIPAIKSCRLFLDLIQSLGIERDRIVFTMNRFDKRISITPERVADNLKQPVAVVIPLDERAAIPAINRGIPFMVDNKTLPAARSVFALAESVRAIFSKVDEENVIPSRR